jgi:hypothetical protein
VDLYIIQGQAGEMFHPGFQLIGEAGVVFLLACITCSLHRSHVVGALFLDRFLVLQLLLLQHTRPGLELCCRTEYAPQLLPLGDHVRAVMHHAL